MIRSNDLVTSNEEVAPAIVIAAAPGEALGAFGTGRLRVDPVGSDGEVVVVVLDVDVDVVLNVEPTTGGSVGVLACPTG